MDSREIERRVEEIAQLIRELHEELIQDETNAWITIPVVGITCTPMTSEMEVGLEIGLATK
jgi:hypothetical protein